MMNCPAFIVISKEMINDVCKDYKYPENIKRLIKDIRIVLTHSKNTYETIYNPKIQ